MTDYVTEKPNPGTFTELDAQNVCDEKLGAMHRTVPLTPNYSMVPTLSVAGEARLPRTVVSEARALVN